jgi:NarL family two-component system response regulator LiaR
MEISIFILDKHPVVRLGLSALLSAESDFQVIGDAANYSECFAKIGASNPDVVILDLEIVDSNQNVVITSLRNLHPKIKLIVYSELSKDWMVTKVIKMELHGYVVKSPNTDNLKAAIRIVSRGERYLDPAITSKLMQTIELIQKRQLQPCIITARELEILKLIAKGYRNKKIAKSLFIAECTVKYHVSAILAKLSVSSRIEAILVAKDQGILQD